MASKRIKKNPCFVSKTRFLFILNANAYGWRLKELVFIPSRKLQQQKTRRDDMATFEYHHIGKSNEHDIAKEEMG